MNWKEQLKRIVGDLNVADDFIPSREAVELAVLEKYSTEIIEKLVEESLNNLPIEPDGVITSIRLTKFKQQLRDKWL